MPRVRLQSLLIVVVALLAFGAMAATLDSGSLPSGNETNVTPGMTEGGGMNSSDRNASGSTISTPTYSCPSLLMDPSSFLAVTGLIFLISLVVYRWRGSALLSLVTGVPLFIGMATLCPSVLVDTIPVINRLAVPAYSQLFLAGGIILAVGGALAFLYISTGDQKLVGGDDDSRDEPVDLSKIGEAAGDAADRIEGQADVSNEVYRAWREMIQHLHVSNPSATTPDEFEERAVEAGMNHRDVSELTCLFKEVRYGEHDPADREAQALTALRRIEDAYTDVDSETEEELE